MKKKKDPEERIGEIICIVLTITLIISLCFGVYLIDFYN